MRQQYPPNNIKMCKNKPVTPERAIEILASHKIRITHEQAEQISAFMSKLAQIAVEIYVKDDVETI